MIRGAAEVVFRLIHSLVHPDVIDFHGRREIFAVTGRERTGTGRIPAFKAFAFAIIWARSGESPR